MSEVKILLVENEASWARGFTELFSDLISADVDIISVYSDFEKKIKEDPGYFEKYDFCFADLELGPASEVEIQDTYGMNVVLRLVREHCPWLPTLCISRYISGSDEIIVECSLSDFDCIIPKRFVLVSNVPSNKPENNESKEENKNDKKDNIYAPNFNGSRCRKLLQDASLKRVSILTGRDINKLKQLCDEKVSFGYCDETKEILSGKLANSFESCVKLMGFGGSEYYVENIQGGFSGINVSRLTVQGSDAEPINTHWLLKWGKRPGKIYIESVSHRNVFSRGANRRIILPQYFHNPLHFNGMSMICYYFEENAKTAKEIILEEGIDGPLGVIAISLSQLYKNSRAKTINIKDEICRTVCLNDCNVDKLNNFIKFKSYKTTLEATWSLLHGDLHCCNIFIANNEALFIDLAKSKNGPIACDIGKVLLDIFLFTNNKKIEAGDIDGAIDEISSISHDLFKFITENDIVLAKIYIYAYLLKYSEYDDVNQDTMDKVSSIIANCQ